MVRMWPSLCVMKMRSLADALDMKWEHPLRGYQVADYVLYLVHFMTCVGGQ